MYVTYRRHPTAYKLPNHPASHDSTHRVKGINCRVHQPPGMYDKLISIIIHRYITDIITVYQSADTIPLQYVINDRPHAFTEVFPSSATGDL